MMHTFAINSISFRGVKRCLAVLLVSSLGVGLTSVKCEQAAPTPLDAAALVRQAVRNRLEEDKDPHRMRYLLRKRNTHRETLKEIVETKDGDVARLVEIDGKPLSAAENHTELERLDNLSEHPELQERKQKGEQKDVERTDHLMSMLPDAELYRMEGVVPCDSGQCYRLSFKPNPKFSPPDLQARLFRGFAGEVLIDRTQVRLVRLDARVIKDVNFGFGILGKIDKGGTVALRQTAVDGHIWELTRLKVNMTGRTLLVKPMSIQIDEETSDFSPVAPDLSYRDAIGC